MVPSALPLALLALAAPLAAATDRPRDLDGVAIAQYTIHEHIVIRVPRMSTVPAPQGRSHEPSAPPVAWKEHKGPTCIDANDLAGALLAPQNAVDLVLRTGLRIRARLEGECRQLDFYSGFYLRPAADGSICAARDMIYIRSGASCGIRTFRRLSLKH